VLSLRGILRERNPAQLVVLAFVVAALVGGVILSLPQATTADRSLHFVDALFMATSALTVTGLGTVPMSQLSVFGDTVVLGLVQVGGFGIMSVGAVLVAILQRSVALRHRTLAQAELGTLAGIGVRRLLARIAIITMVAEATIALILMVRLTTSYDMRLLPAAAEAVFHGVSAFNNAGITLYDDSLIRFVTDPFVILPITAAFIFGGLGFPVMLEILERRPFRRYTLHSKLTIVGTAVLLLVGPLMVAVFEWTNPSTLGELDLGGKFLASWFQGTTPRTAGFSTLDTAELRDESLLGTISLMFIGAGPVSTSGGIKVTTFALLGFVLLSEARGDSDTTVIRRRIPQTVIRQAIAVVILAIGSIMAGTFVILVSSDVGLSAALFEATSAFGTVGLSTGITEELPRVSHLVLVVLMLAGRVGPATLVTALAFKQRTQWVRYPEERPIIG
jgi:trk system potassium uptake protein